MNPRGSEAHDSKNNTENNKSQALEKQVCLPGLTTTQMTLYY